MHIHSSPLNPGLPLAAGAARSAFSFEVTPGQPSAAVSTAGRWSALRSLAASALASMIALAAVMASAQSTLYWDTNGTTAGSGAATGTWGPGNSLWNTDPTGGAGGLFTDATTSADTLLVSAGTNGTTGTITVSGTQAANSLTFRNNVAVTVSGGTAIGLGSTSGAGIFALAGVNANNTVSTSLVLGANVAFQNLGGVSGSNPSLIISGGITGTGNIAITNSGVGSSVSFGSSTLNPVGTVSYAGTSYATQTLPIVGANVTGVTQSSNAFSLKLASAYTVATGGTTFTKTGLQNLYLYNQSISGTGNLVFNNNSAYANANGLDVYGQGTTNQSLNNTGSITNSGTGVGGTRIVAQIGANVTSVTQNSATSNLYLMNTANTTGSGNGTMSNNASTGAVNIDAGILYSGYAGAFTSAGSIVFRGGTLMYGAVSTTDLSSKMSTNGTAAYRIDTNGLSVTLASNLAANGTSGLGKFGPGTLILTAGNTYTGTTTIGGGTGTLQQLAGGTLQVGNGVTGTLNGSVGTDLDFRGTGTFNVQQAAGSTQTMKALTFTAGDGTVQSTYAGTPGTNVSTVSFASVVAPAAGATANYSISGSGVNGVDNRITLGGQATGVMGKSSYFGGSAYAAYDAGGYVRAVSYGSDATAPAPIAAGATLGVNDATQNVQIDGSISAQTTASVNTLRIPNASNLALAGGTLSLNGMLKTGATTLGAVSRSTVGGRAGSALSVASLNSDLVVRVDAGGAAPDIVAIDVPLLANGTNDLVKSGAGWLKVSGANGLTGNVAVNQGTLQLDTPTARTYGGVIGGAGNLFVSGPGTLTLSGPAATLTGDLTISTGTLKLDFSAAGAPAADMINPGARIVLGFAGGQTNVSGGGTLLITGKSSGVTTQNLGIRPAGVVTSGVNSQPGSSRILVDPNGGAATNVGFGKLGNVIATSDTATSQNIPTNGSGLLIGKTAGAGTGDVNFVYSTDGRNGPSNGTNLSGRLVYTDDGGANVDFVTTSQQESGVYSIIPIRPLGTAGAQYTYTPFNGSGGSTTYQRFDGTMSSVTLATNLGPNGIKIENPGPGKSITVNTGVTLSSSFGIIMTGSDDFSILGGNLSTTNNGNGRTYVFQQYSSGTLTVSSVLNDATSTAGLVKLGPGRLILSGLNLYPSTTFISEGTLQAGVAQNGTTSGPFGTSGSIVFAGGTLQYSSANQQDYSSRFRTGDGEPIRIDTNTQNVTFATALASSRGTLDKFGSGTLTLSAANTYSGNTTISGGTLALTGTIASSPTIAVGAGATFNVLVRSGLTLAAGQELKGDGTALGNITLGTGSILTPGTSGVGALKFEGNLTLTPTAMFKFDLGSPATPGTTYDQIQLLSNTGFWTFDPAGINFSNFEFNALTGFGEGTYTLFSATDNAYLVSGGALGSSLTGQINGLDATLSLGGTNNASVILTVVPEPETFVLLGVGLAAIGFLRRRRA